MLALCVAFLGRLLGCGVLLLGGLLPAAHAVLPDAEGYAYDGALPARRIVSLAPHLTDILVSLGASAQIVGVGDDHESRGTHRLSRSGFAIVADSGSINYERILALQPDLVLAWGGGTPRAWIARLRQLGLPVFVSDATTLAALATQVEELGMLSGRSESARRQASQLRRDIAQLQQQYRGAAKLRYFHQVWLQPLYSLNADTLLSQALLLCGADNIVAAGPVAAPLINPEFVVAANPDFILVSSGNMQASRRYWQRFPGLAAVTQQHIVALNDRRLTRPGPELLQAVIPLCARLRKPPVTRATKN